MAEQGRGSGGSSARPDAEGEVPAPDREPDATFLDEVRRRPRFRAFFAKHPALEASYRVAVGALGAAVVALGIVLIPLPGPGWLIVFAGLAILATEFVWAERLLQFARRQVHGWTEWVTRQSLVVRLLIGLAGLLFVATVVWAYQQVVGFPPWVPFL